MGGGTQGRGGGSRRGTSSGRRWEPVRGGGGAGSARGEKAPQRGWEEDVGVLGGRRRR